MIAGLGIAIVLSVLAFKVFVFAARLALSVLGWVFGALFSPLGLFGIAMLFLAWVLHQEREPPPPCMPAPSAQVVTM